MKLTVLGSGTFISGPERAATGFALEFGKRAIIIDLGFGCFKNLQKAGIDLSKVSDLFFTHFEHPDHVNDLSAFLFAKKGFVKNDLAPKNQVNIFGGPGFKSFVERLFDAYPCFKDLPFGLGVSELEPFCARKLSGFAFTAKQMKHAPSSIGLRFEAGGKSVVFSGDTEPNENLVDLAKNADLLVAECNFAEKKGGDHMNAEQVADIAARANTKALLLHHFAPEAEKANVKALAAKKFNGKIYLAKDLMEVQF